MQRIAQKRGVRTPHLRSTPVAFSASEQQFLFKLDVRVRPQTLESQMKLGVITSVISQELGSWLVLQRSKEEFSKITKKNIHITILKNNSSASYIFYDSSETNDIKLRWRYFSKAHTYKGL